MQPLREDDSLKPSEIARNVNEIQRSLEPIDPVISARTGTTEPPASVRRAGKLAYADGVSWDPGGGEGYYFWTKAGAWQKL